jgi:hypothetical protein
MNPENELINNEVSRLRNELAPDGAKERLVSKLVRRPATVRNRQLSLAATCAVAVILALTFMLPQSASARARAVYGALSAARSYRIQSFGHESGERLLRGETVVNGSDVQISMFDEKGNRLPKELVNNVLEDVKEHRDRGYLNEKNETGNTSNKISSALIVDGRMIGPATVKGMAFNAPNGKRYIVYAGLSTLSELSDFLNIEDAWTLERNVVYRGRTLDLLRLPDCNVSIYVDSKTNLPAYVRIQDCEDVYDFGTP